jgi:glycosyltransferase involved in cell wall biosynthesis
LFVGQYIPRKGIPELLDAFVRSGSHWGLDFCGGGPLAPLIRRYAKRFPQIRDLGFVQPLDLPTIFASAEAFVLPSREDHWGVAVLEAAAAGLPIICSNACGAAADLVQHGHSGFVVPARNERRLADAVAALAGLTEEARQRMGACARGLARKFDVSRWAQTLHQLIDELSPRRESART